MKKLFILVLLLSIPFTSFAIPKSKAFFKTTNTGIQLLKNWNLVAAYDYQNGYATNTGSVATWQDLSGNGYTLTQALDAKKLSYTARGLQGNADGLRGMSNATFTVNATDTYFSIVMAIDGDGGAVLNSFEEFVCIGSTSYIIAAVSDPRLWFQRTTAPTAAMGSQYMTSSLVWCLNLQIASGAEFYVNLGSGWSMPVQDTRVQGGDAVKGLTLGCSYNNTFGMSEKRFIRRAYFFKNKLTQAQLSAYNW